MASLAINLMVLLFIMVVSTAKGFKIENTQSNIGFQKHPSFSSEHFQYPSFSIENSNFPVQPFTRQYQNVNEGPIAGYPKVPPLNAYESGGVDGDLLPPLEDSSLDQKKKNQFFRRSTDFEKVGVNPQPKYPLFVSVGYENTGENQEILKLSPENPLLSKNVQEEKAVDPKTRYPLIAHPSWQDAGGNGDTLELPLEESVEKTDEEKVDPKTGYPLQAQSHWKDAGGNEDILELPLEDFLPSKNSENESAVDPKTGYPLKAEPFWKDAGGNEDILELPLEESLSSIPSKTFENEKSVDPKTKYPLQADPHWKDAGGNEDILKLPLEDPLPDSSPSKTPQNNNAVDPKTGYPLKAEPEWKDAGGNEDILELPLEDILPSKNAENESAVDPKTGYPLRAEPFWREAGGNEDILELPLEDPLPLKTYQNNNAVDPKTGYPLKAEPHWKDAGGNEDILELPLESLIEETDKKIDLKTGYPLMAENSWKDAGGNGDILDLPLEFTEEKNKDKKTGYPFVAESSFGSANGNKEISDFSLKNNMNRFIPKSEVEAQQLINQNTNYPFLKSLIAGTGDDTLNQPVSKVEKNFKVDPKTGYPLVAQLEWSLAGGDGNILQLPINDFVNQIQGRSGEIINEDLLTELRPPSPESNYYTGFGSFPFSPVPLIVTQIPAFGGVQFFDSNRIPRRPFGESENTRQQNIYTLTYPDNAVVTVSHYTFNDNQNIHNAPERLTNFNQKQFIQSFTEEKTLQNNKENSFPFPIIHTAVNQQFKTYQPSEISNFQNQQHQIKQHPPFLIPNIATRFT